MTGKIQGQPTVVISKHNYDFVMTETILHIKCFRYDRMNANIRQDEVEPIIITQVSFYIWAFKFSQVDSTNKAHIELTMRAIPGCPSYPLPRNEHGLVRHSLDTRS